MTDETRNGMMPAEDIVRFSREKGFLAKMLYVILTHPTGGLEKIRENSDAHLKRQLQLEADGILFGAGPIMTADGKYTSGEGMAIIRAESLQEAHRIAREDPMHSSGARTYEILPWLMNEGSVTIRFDYGHKIATLA